MMRLVPFFSNYFSSQAFCFPSGKKAVWLTLFFYLITALTGNAQTISGKVVDPAGEALAFVNVLINESGDEGVIADINGKFIIENVEGIRTLTFSYMGYRTRVIEIENRDNIEVVLEPEYFNLTEVEVVAGENPAHRIIREAVKRKRHNDHEEWKEYKCRLYSKSTVTPIAEPEEVVEWVGQSRRRSSRAERNKVDLDTASVRQSLESAHLMLMEVVTDRFYRAPNRVRNKLIHNRVSGMSRPEFTAMNNMQQFSFYGDFLQIMDRRFLNPISKKSETVYYFNIEDTLYHANDSIFLISYKPKNYVKAETLKGILYINSSNYALQYVIAEPSDATKFKWRLEHKYEWISDTLWFPEQLNLEFTMPHPTMKFLTIKWSQKTYVKQVDLFPDLNTRDLMDQREILTDEQVSKADSIWNLYRIESLSPKDTLTYFVMDSIGEKIKFDAIMKISSSLGAGLLEWKWMDILFSETLLFNEFEGVRIGLGLRTNKRLSKYFSLGGYAGYGWKDKRWKYKAEGFLHLIPDQYLRMGYRYQNTLSPASRVQEITDNTIFVDEGLYTLQMDRIESHSAIIDSRLKFLEMSLVGQRRNVLPQYEYAYLDEAPYSNFTFTTLGLNVRFAYGENYDWVLGSRVTFPTKYPIISMSYEKGFEGLLDGQFDYHLVTASVEQRFNVRFLGQTEYRIEAGWTSRDLPMTRLFQSVGAGGSIFSFFAADNSFQTMDANEFLSDRYVHLFLEHNFGTLFYRHEYSRPRVSVLHNMGYGSLSAPENHRLVDFSTMEKGFFESGVGITDLIRIPVFNVGYIGLGGAFYYRYGPNRLPNNKDNMAFRMRISFSY